MLLMRKIILLILLLLISLSVNAAYVDKLNGDGKFDDSGDFSSWTITNGLDDGNFITSPDTTTYLAGGGSLQAFLSGNNKDLNLDYIEYSVAVTGGYDVMLNFSWRKGYSSSAPAYNYLYINIINPSLSDQEVWSDLTGTYDTWTNESINLTSYFTATGTYTIKIIPEMHTNSGDSGQEQYSWIDELFLYVDEPDTTAPATVTSLGETDYDTDWILWNWTNPADGDFDYNIIYIDGTWEANTSNEYYNVTGLSSGTTYNITINTIDTTGNINDTNVTDEATTSSGAASVSFSVAYPSSGCSENYGCTTGSCTACTYCHFNASVNTISDLKCTGQTSGTSFWTITNDGDISMDINISINQTLPGTISFKLDTDNDPSGATTITTASQLLCSSIPTSSSCTLWGWADYVAATAQTTDRDMLINATQS